MSGEDRCKAQWCRAAIDGLLVEDLVVKATGVQREKVWTAEDTVLDAFCGHVEEVDLARYEYCEDAATVFVRRFIEGSEVVKEPCSRCRPLTGKEYASIQEQVHRIRMEEYDELNRRAEEAEEKGPDFDKRVVKNLGREVQRIWAGRNDKSLPEVVRRQYGDDAYDLVRLMAGAKWYLWSEDTAWHWAWTLEGLREDDREMYRALLEVTEHYAGDRGFDQERDLGRW